MHFRSYPKNQYADSHAASEAAQLQLDSSYFVLQAPKGVDQGTQNKSNFSRSEHEIIMPLKHKNEKQANNSREH
jgi:hypothetical protein